MLLLCKAVTRFMTYGFGICMCSTCWDQSFSELVVILPDYALRISLGTFSILLCIITNFSTKKDNSGIYVNLNLNQGYKHFNICDQIIIFLEPLLCNYKILTSIFYLWCILCNVCTVVFPVPNIFPVPNNLNWIVSHTFKWQCWWI